MSARASGSWRWPRAQQFDRAGHPIRQQAAQHPHQSGVSCVTGAPGSSPSITGACSSSSAPSAASAAAPRGLRQPGARAPLCVTGIMATVAPRRRGRRRDRRTCRRGRPTTPPESARRVRPAASAEDVQARLRLPAVRTVASREAWRAARQEAGALPRWSRSESRSAGRCRAWRREQFSHRPAWFNRQLRRRRGETAGAADAARHPGTVRWG